MFSDHLQKIDNASGKTLLLIAGGLVIVCQLVALVLVSQGQVEKAQAREVSRASQSTTSAWCFETSHGDELRGCASRPPAYTAKTNALPAETPPDGYLPAMAATRY